MLKIAAITLLLAGCATQSHITLDKNVSDSEKQQDNYACRMEAEKVQTPDWEYRGTFMEGASIKNKQNKIYGLCLRSRGYVEVRRESN